MDNFLVVCVYSFQRDNGKLCIVTDRKQHAKDLKGKQFTSGRRCNKASAERVDTASPTNVAMRILYTALLLHGSTIIPAREHRQHKTLANVPYP